MRKALVIGGLVVVALVAALWLALKKDLSNEQEASADDKPATGGPGANPPTRAQHPTVTQGTVGERPAIPDPPPGENPRDYAVGDVRVRDHRSGDRQLLDIPPNMHPADSRRIPSTLTHEISQKVRDVMMQCVADVPREARGDKPRLEGQIAVSIKNQQLTVTGSTMHLRNMSGQSVEPAKQCIEQKSVGLVNPAPDQDDLDNYTINITFAIP